MFLTWALILSLMQLRVETTPQMRNNMSKMCDSWTYSSVSPFRFQLKSTNSDRGTGDWLGCPWPQSNSAFRILVYSLALLTQIILIVFTCHSEWLRMHLTQFGLSVWVQVVWFTCEFVLVTIDSHQVVIGYQTCSNYFETSDLGGHKTSLEDYVYRCSVHKFVRLIIIEVFAILFTLVIYLVFRQFQQLKRAEWKKMKDGQQLELAVEVDSDSDEPEALETPDSKPASALKQKKKKEKERKSSLKQESKEVSASGSEVGGQEVEEEQFVKTRTSNPFAGSAYD
jgi:hypothetical protein